MSEVTLNYDALREFRERLTLVVLSVDALLSTEPVADPDPVMITGPQMRAFHAMCRDLDNARGVPHGDSKAALKRRWGKESTKDFTRQEASEMLDELDHILTFEGVTPA